MPPDHVATADEDGELRIWSIELSRPIRSNTSAQSINDMTFDTKGRLVHGVDDGSIRKWDVREDRTEQTCEYR